MTMNEDMSSRSAETGISKGRDWLFGDDINTDIIIPFRFKSRTNDLYEMAKYAMYGFEPDFHKKISKGDRFYPISSAIIALKKNEHAKGLCRLHMKSS